MNLLIIKVGMAYQDATRPKKMSPAAKKFWETPRRRSKLALELISSSTTVRENPTVYKIT